MISEQIKQQILDTIINRAKIGDKISADRIIDINTKFYTDGNYTMCKINSKISGRPEITEVGFSKRNPNYPQLKFNKELGEMLSFVNAAKRYVSQLINRGICI